MVTNSFSWIVKLMPRSARTVSSPTMNSRRTSINSMIVQGAVYIGIGSNNLTTPANIYLLTRSGQI